MVTPEVMVSEFASPFPPLLMETVTAKGMVRSSAAVGTPAGFQFAAVFHEPLAALAHVRPRRGPGGDQQHGQESDGNTALHGLPLFSISVARARQRRKA